MGNFSHRHHCPDPPDVRHPHELGHEVCGRGVSTHLAAEGFFACGNHGIQRTTTRNLEILCMKKKMLCSIIIVIAFFVCCIVYFKPLSLSDIAEADNQMKMIYSQLGVENGEAYIDSVNYQDITIDQKNTILSLLYKYTYRRTVGTLFSNGSTSDLGDKTLSIYVYDDASLINSVLVTSSGKVVINEKTYNMEDAEQFIEQIIQIMN